MSRKTRKLIWAVPLMAVVAAIGALALFMTQTPHDASAQVTSGKEVPGMVQKLTVAANKEGTPQTELLVSWEAPKDGGYVTSYRIDISDDGKRWVPHVADHGANDLSLVSAGLKAESTKHFRVFAWNQHGTGPGTDAMGTTSKSTKPDRPTNPSATVSTTADATVTYRLDLNGDGDTADPDVDNVKESDFGVDFCNNAGALNPDGDTNDTCDNVPENVDRTVSGRTAIGVQWDAPDDPPGAPVTGYRIEYSLNGTRWHTLIANAPLYSPTTGTYAYADRGLLANTTRQYRVYATNRYGTSSVSDGAEGSTANSAVPIAIADGGTNMRIGLSPSATDVHLSWTAPADPDGDPVSRYRVQARPGASTSDDDWKDLHAGEHIQRTSVYNFGGDDLRRAGITVPVNIPDTGISVDIRIAAINRRNANSADNATGETAVNWKVYENVPVGDPDVPRKAGKPTVKQDRSQHQGRSGLDVTWPAAEFIQGKGPTSDNFGSNVSYVLVINGAPQSAVSHTDALPSGGDTGKPGYDDNGRPTESARRYILYADNTDTQQVSDVTNAEISSFPSAMAMGTTARPTLPGTPDSFSVTGDGHTEIKLAWTAPDAGAQTPDPCATDDPVVSNAGDGSECGASVITGYKIEISDTGTSGWKTLEESHRSSPYTAQMLQPGKRYYFRVSALNSRGPSVPTAAESDTTHEAGAPTPPGGLVAQAMGHTAIKLCWFEQNLVDPLTGQATLDEGLPVLGYRITYLGGTDGKTETVLVENTGSKDTEYTDTGLMAGQSRTYRVYSITLGGVGTTYDTATGSTMDASLPGKPTAVMAAADSDTAITVKWTAPTETGGAAITGYKVMWKLSSATDYADADMATAAPGAVMHQVTGLTASTAYTVKVMAMNAKGDSAASDEATATTDRSNAAPTVAEEIADVQVTDMGAGNMKTSAKAASAYFADTDAADMGKLTITAESADPTVATASLNDAGMIVVTGVKVGETTVTVTATDTGNMAGKLDVPQTFKVTVTSGNMAPTVSKMIADMTAMTGDAATTMDLSMNFSDADKGDNLSYKATSDNEAVATASVEGNMLTVAITGAGKATITVTADDGKGGKVSDKFDVTVTLKLVAPTNIRTNPVGSGTVLVGFDPVAGADGYYIYAGNLTNPDEKTFREVVNNPNATSGGVDGLVIGDDYLIAVASFNGENLDGKLSEIKRLTVE